MCGRFTLTLEQIDELATELGVTPDEVMRELHRARFNIAPMQDHLVVRMEQEQRVITPATWGLVNWWEPGRREGAKYINARAETIEARRTFRDAFSSTRCIVPADGFIEWVGEGALRRPFWFHRPDRAPFVFAGLYVESCLPSDVAPVTTFTIITTSANTTVGHVHDRMPVILQDDEAIEEWLYGRQSAERLRSLLVPAADDFLVATPVSTRVNSVQHDDPACLEEAERETQVKLL